MNKLTVESTLRWVLAAWTLLATTLVSPTVVHSHFEGYRPHGHDRSDSISVGLLQPSRSGGDQGGYRRGISLSGADCHEHRYLLLVGAVEYLPVSGEPGSSHQKSQCGWETILAVSAAPGMRACSNGLAVDQLQLASLANRSVDCICQSGQHEISAPDAAPSAPLCDRARHERSGVQLA